MDSSNKSFANFISSRRFDIILCHDETASVVLDVLDAHNFAIPVVIHRGHSSRVSREVLYCYEHPLTARVLAVSKRIASQILEEIDSACSEKIDVVYSGTDITTFHPRPKNTRIMKELGIAGSNFVIGMVGHVRPYKRVDIFLAASSLVRERFPESIFVVVGKVTRRYVKTIAKRLGEVLKVREGVYCVGKHILFTDLRTDIPDVLSVFDVSVNCSDQYEGISGAMRESLAMEIPVVCTDVGGASELVRDGFTGFLIPPSNAAALADRVCFVLQNYEYAKGLAREGRKQVEKRFSISERNTRVEEILRQATWRFSL